MSKCQMEMDGRMDGWTSGRVDGCTDGFTGGYDGHSGGRRDNRTDGRLDLGQPNIVTQRFAGFLLRVLKTSGENLRFKGEST